jgi:hypothetical protein
MDGDFTALKYRPALARSTSFPSHPPSVLGCENAEETLRYTRCISASRSICHCGMQFIDSRWLPNEYASLCPSSTYSDDGLTGPFWMGTASLHANAKSPFFPGFKIYRNVKDYGVCCFVSVRFSCFRSHN